MTTDNKILSQLTNKTKRLEAELQQARIALKSRGGGNGGRASKSWLGADDSSQPKEEEETWFATYLDMMTLLLVLMIVMLAFAGKGDFISGHDRAGSAAITGGAGEGQQPGAPVLRDGTGAKTGGFEGELAAMGFEGQYIEIGRAKSNDKDNNSGGKSDISDAESARRLSEMGFSELGDDIDVILNEGTVSFRINSEILFTSGQADLGLAGISVLKKLVSVLKKNDYQIAVEGHTDSIPIRGRYPSNWELSGSRAGSVVRYFESNGIESNRLRAVGYADTRPLELNETADGRAKNRRVELTMEIPK